MDWRDYGKGAGISSMPDVPGIAVFYPGIQVFI